MTAAEKLAVLARHTRAFGTDPWANLSDPVAALSARFGEQIWQTLDQMAAAREAFDRVSVLDAVTPPAAGPRAKVR